MGSSVKLTKSDTSTAKATVTPNWKKILPMMPPMKATGMNTATTAKVVDITARPISLVPSRAASSWVFPISRCRTMFSRTTMASSIRSPIASDSASRVIVLRVKFSTHMMKKELMIEMGRVSPVMTVDRHELRNR